MAEYTANVAQIVEPNQAMLFTDTAVRGNTSVMHREGSGLVTLRAITCQPYATFKVTFGADIAVPTGGTAGPISMAFAISGEPDTNTEMTVTPAAVEEYFNISRTTTIRVPGGCCSQISVENTSDADISVQHANLIVERVA